MNMYRCLDLIAKIFVSIVFLIMAISIIGLPIFWRYDPVAATVAAMIVLIFSLVFLAIGVSIGLTVSLIRLKMETEEE